MDSPIRAPRWRRRSADRPAEIAAAALDEFGARGFAAAKVSEIAARAGISKAALYNYYPTKLDMFRAVIAQHASPDIARVLALGPPDLAFGDRLALILPAAARIMSRPELGRLLRMVIAESGNFPELAVLWRSTVVEPAVNAFSAVLARAQSRGEARPGNPRLLALSAIGPLVTGVVWREVMEPAGAEPLDLSALALEHLRTLAHGLVESRTSA